MKLPDFTTFRPLNKIRELMKAPLPDDVSLRHDIGRLTLLDLEAMEGSGLDIEIDDIRELEDGTLAYKDSRVLLYIRDIPLYHNRSFQDSLPKFHVANCDTLKRMKANKRYDRYVVSVRKDGKFEVIFIRGNGRNKTDTCELKICKNCLNYISYKGYADAWQPQKVEIYNNFQITEYFEKYPRSIIVTPPTHDNYSAPLNDYGPGFRETSRRYRAENDWSCEKCKVDLSHTTHRKYLHTHHINGLKYDNTPGNLQALCIQCHANEPMSAHIENLPDYKEFIRLYPALKRISS